MLTELLKSGYTAPALLAVSVLLTRHVWAELARTFRDWVRSGPARRRANLEKKVVDHALGNETREQRDHSIKLLRLLLNARDRSLPESPPAAPDPPPDETPGDTAAHT
ncbi:hypothetical protein ACFWN2_33805 [Lentzea sp. NPDC058436]|uniref:hypothetical protein n=1 Tax=Lentzea sp. NPDC058436 TaxID=3346499 RepID=UPI0036658A15